MSMICLINKGQILWHVQRVKLKGPTLWHVQQSLYMIGRWFDTPNTINTWELDELAHSTNPIHEGNIRWHIPQIEYMKSRFVYTFNKSSTNAIHDGKICLHVPPSQYMKAKILKHMSKRYIGQDLLWHSATLIHMAPILGHVEQIQSMMDRWLDAPNQSNTWGPSSFAHSTNPYMRARPLGTINKFIA